ncbi:GNAT family N-acetyltransferase [Shewanella gaetbuli]|uniref:GNAT family N-acetyltransferase n=1 Tax=Shewanella gaetbuli TaxID=220752 RepID=A0A9X1ZHF7_9GAMM|nr:GNAT family N-acetyltransferase [Shewanella gaetbuli]MCL1142374.1 GNAT family N-acetyltransferase [Shewanella gaetbuli]
MSQVDIRPATIADSGTILRFVKELAEYERALDQVEATLSSIEHSIFGEGSTTDAIICSVDGQVIGFAVYFFNYSTWLGKNGLYLEDLYISPEYRKIGAGKALLKYLAKLAVSKNCGRFEWCVLDWNTPAIDFYESIGAKPQDEWTVYRLTGEKLKLLAES